MSFAGRLTQAPRALDADRASECAAAFGDLAPELRALLGGTAGSSPYLRASIHAEAEWVRSALDRGPEMACARLLDQIAGLPDVDLKVGLRRAKRRYALIVALADLGGVWALDQVTASLTNLADLAVQRAMGSQVAIEIARNKLPGQGAADVDSMGGMVALAMGKMGAFELNYSSDIDLICLFDETRFAPSDFADARAAFIRATRRAMTLLSEQTGDGYVFRTDLRLRPDPGVTPVCMAMDAAERYYESVGRTWERAAHIKARACAGDLPAGAAYLGRLAPFVWRKHLDFTAIQDAHDMRLRIRAHKGLGGAIALPGHDMKLGRGGIREIEFFTQTRQIIAGGRDKNLQVAGTVEGLERLADAGWVDRDLATDLTRDYVAHREVEHRLQMIADQQTHTLPQDAVGFDRLAALMDCDTAQLTADLTQRLDRVAAATEGFFAPDPPQRDQLPDLTPDQRAIIDRWTGYPALRSPRGLRIFERIQPGLLRKLLDTPRPDQTLLHFDGFLAGLPAGVQIFSLFDANPQLTDLIVDVAGTTAELAKVLSQFSQVLDAFIAGDFFAPWPSEAQWLDELTTYLDHISDYEGKLDAARRWTRERKFRVGVHLLRGLIDAHEAGAHYARLARAVLQALWPVIEAEFARKYGTPPGRGAMILGMGALGAGRLHGGSDLDLIVIYDADGVESSDGKRPLASRSYYARLTQALVTALSAPMAEGRLYEVDMRLRPSGRQGPVATALAAFETYQRNDAWTWEHLALTRADPIAGQQDLQEAVSSVRQDVLRASRDSRQIKRDVADMRRRLAQARPGSVWDVKAGAGRLQEVELIANMLGLLAGSDARDVPGQIAAGVDAGHIADDAAEALTASYDLFAKLRIVSRLLGEGLIDPSDLGGAAEAVLVRETGAADLSGVEDQVKLRSTRAALAVGALLTGADV